MRIINSFRALTRFERGLWMASLVVVTISFFLGGERDPISLIASVIGVTALIFVARGNVLGQVLTVAFALLYAAVSYRLRYYGEMITYLGMTSPIALLSVITWLRNPFDSKRSEVKVAGLSPLEYIFAFVLSGVVTAVFYFILRAMGNASLGASTLSIMTSFLASYLTMRRSPFYGLAYAANDLVLIILWAAALTSSLSYLPMLLCFVMFFINDLYGFINWHRMERRQRETYIA